MPDSADPGLLSFNVFAKVPKPALQPPRLRVPSLVTPKRISTPVTVKFAGPGNKLNRLFGFNLSKSLSESTHWVFRPPPAISIDKRCRCQFIESIQPQGPAPGCQNDLFAQPGTACNNDPAPRAGKQIRPFTQPQHHAVTGRIVIHDNHTMFERMNEIHPALRRVIKPGIDPNGIVWPRSRWIGAVLDRLPGRKMRAPLARSGIDPRQRPLRPLWPALQTLEPGFDCCKCHSLPQRDLCRKGRGTDISMKNHRRPFYPLLMGCKKIACDRASISPFGTLMIWR